MAGPHLEIEADSTVEVLAAARAFGYQPDDLTSENTVQVYARAGIDLLAVPDLRF
jgi:adenylate cyclase, class 2